MSVAPRSNGLVSLPRLGAAAAVLALNVREDDAEAQVQSRDVGPLAFRLLAPRALAREI